MTLADKPRTANRAGRDARAVVCRELIERVAPGFGEKADRCQGRARRSVFLPTMFADPGKQPLILTAAYRALAKDKVRPDLPKAVFFRPMSNPAPRCERTR